MMSFVLKKKKDAQHFTNIGKTGTNSREEGRIGGEREVNTREWHQIGLELVQINVEGSIKSERSSDAGDDLGNQPV